MPNTQKIMTKLTLCIKNKQKKNPTLQTKIKNLLRLLLSGPCINHDSPALTGEKASGLRPPIDSGSSLTHPCLHVSIPLSV